MTSVYDELLHALRRVRQECPWMREKSYDSLIPYFIEELHEYIEARETFGPSSPSTWEELGDVLFQVSLHSLLLEEEGHTHLENIARGVLKKVIDRHPHVFDPQHPKFATAAEAGKAWEELKRLKKSLKVSQETRTDKLKSVPKSLPSLQRAWRIGEKTHSFNFDWKDPQQVLQKVEEEYNEFLQAPTESNQQEEFGDLLFSLAQFARHKGWDPEKLLQNANNKFIRRFDELEKHLNKEGLEMEALSTEELEKAWQAIKKS